MIAYRMNHICIVRTNLREMAGSILDYV